MKSSIKKAGSEDPDTTHEEKELSDFLNFEISNDDQFYVLWYRLANCEYSDEYKEIQHTAKDETHFMPSDNVELNTWALLWEITNSDKPHMGLGRIKWMYINKIQENAILDAGYEYTTCAIQTKEWVPQENDPQQKEPFEITKEVENAFRKAIIDPEIAQYLIQEQEDNFDLSRSFKGLPMLIEKMKEYMRSDM